MSTCGKYCFFKALIVGFDVLLRPFHQHRISCKIQPKGVDFSLPVKFLDNDFL